MRVARKCLIALAIASGVSALGAARTNHKVQLVLDAGAETESETEMQSAAAPSRGLMRRERGRAAAAATA